MFHIKNYRDDCLYAIFDDISDGLMGMGGSTDRLAYKQWIGAQPQITITDKYHKRRTIRWGRPCIVLLNVDPFLDKRVDRDWVMGNALVLHIETVIARFKPAVHIVHEDPPITDLACENQWANGPMDLWPTPPQSEVSNIPDTPTYRGDLSTI
jgi:hypothetical protein